jgi:hypothetical protein
LRGMPKASEAILNGLASIIRDLMLVKTTIPVKCLREERNDVIDPCWNGF